MSGRRAVISRHLIARWSAPVTIYIACTAILLAFGTPLSAILLYSIYVLVTATVPGTLVWRMLGTNPRSFVEEVAAGTTLGLCVHALLTWLLSLAGVPRLAALWAVGVIVACSLYPPMRKFWRSGAVHRQNPAWMGWALGLVGLVAVWWVAGQDYSNHAIAEIPGRSGEWFGLHPHVDVVYNQAIAAMVLHGGDRFPHIAAVPLEYQLMAHEHLADAARWTGVDLTLLTLRLHVVPLVILAVLLCGVIAHRITNSPTGAALGAAFAYLTSPAPLWHDTSYPLIQVASLNLGVLRSSTQTFGQPILHLLLLLLIVMISARRLGAAQLFAFAGIAFVAGGAKATFLPQIVCALLGVLVIGRIRKAKITGRVIVTVVISAVAFGLALLTILGTSSTGLEPSSDVTAIRWTAFAPLLRDLSGADGRAAIGTFLVVGWLLGAGAAVAAGIFRRKDLSVWLLLGIGLTGFGGSLLSTHPSLSQIWFLRGAWPILGTLAGIGVYEAARRVRAGGSRWSVVILGLLAGLASVYLMRRSFPIPVEYEGARTWAMLFAPIVVVLAIAVALGVLAALALGLSDGKARPSRRTQRAVGALVAIATLQGVGLYQIAHSGLIPIGPVSLGPAIDPDGAYAARWLRENSNAGDTVATNMHCVNPAAAPVEAFCDGRHFWFGALSERQMLLEGWSYAPAPPEVAPDWPSAAGRSRFWDPEFLARNDDAILRPTAESTQWLRDRSVDWIAVNRAVETESRDLGTFAELVLEHGDFAIYHLHSDPTGSVND